MVFRLFYIFIFSLVSIFSQQIEMKYQNPENLESINSEFNDFAPSHNKYNNKLYISSDRTGYSYIYNLIISDSIYQKVSLLKDNINMPKNNQGFINFISENEAYITTFRMAQSRSYQNLFKSVFIKNSWTEPFPVKQLIDNSYTGQSSVSPDGNTLILISDRNNNDYETDLFISEKTASGIWGDLIPIENLNSRGNEITPFFAGNDTLYFSSDGYGGFGGFDIYYSVRKFGEWQRPRALNDLNTEFNESDLIILPNKDILFASDRPGGIGNLDIYKSKLIPVINRNDNIVQYQISVKTQVPNIRIKKERSDNIIAFNQRIKPIPNNTDRLFLDSLAKRMKKFPYSSIILMNKIQTDTIINYLADKGIDKNRIKFSDENTIDLDYIYIDSEFDELFLPVNINNTNYKIEPSVLEISIDARPREAVNKWKCSAICGNIDTVIQSGNRLPVKIYYNLKQINRELFNNDTLKVTFQDVNDKDKYSEINLISIKNIISKHNIISKDNYLYFYYYFILRDTNDLRNKSFDKLKNILNLIETDRVIIQYSDEKYLQNIKKYIQENYEDIIIEFEKEEFDDFDDNSGLYKILIRKIR